MILSPTLGLYDHKCGFYEILNNGIPIIKIRGPMVPNFCLKILETSSTTKKTL